MRPYITAKAYGKKSTILMRHRHQFGKKSDARSLRTRTFIVWFVETPELLGIVPSKEIRIFLKKVLECFQVIILNMSMSTTCRLTSEPHSIVLTHGSPRLI